MDRGVDLGLVHPVSRQPLQGVQHDLLDLFGVFGCDVLQACPKDGLAIVILQTAPVRHRGTELGIDQRFAQG